MSYGIEFVPGNITVKQVITFCKLAESKDIDYAWITNHYNNRHCYPTLAAVAMNTTTLKMGPGIMNSFTDTPAAMASYYCTLNEISDGRAVLGIGPGDLSTLPKIAITPDKPVARLEEAVTIIRQLVAGETVTKKGRTFFDYDGAKLTGVTLPGKKGVPIYIGAQGPKVLDLAGRVGDGALINASNPKDFAVAIPIIKAACDKVGKKGFDVGAYTAMSIDKDVKIEIEFWNFTMGARLSTSIHLMDKMGAVILASANFPSANLIEDEWFGKPHPVGLYRTVCTLPGNFLNEGLHNINAIVLTNVTNVEVFAKDVISFTVNDTGDMRKEYSGGWVGVVRPKLAWQTQYRGPLHNRDGESE